MARSGAESITSFLYLLDPLMLLRVSSRRYGCGNGVSTRCGTKGLSRHKQCVGCHNVAKHELICNNVSKFLL
jgi:hypothetical protein